MKLMKLLTKYLFPPKCVFCRRVMEQDGICEKCKKSLPYRIPQESKKLPMFIDAAYSCFHYEGDVKNAIIRYKFGGLAGYAVEFSGYIEKSITAALGDKFDYISWVPLSKKRYRKRGYDQAKLLADEVASKLGTHTTSTLIKIRDSAPQSRQNDISHRKANILGAYELANVNVNNKRIILIDDVLTTGSTVSECARILKTAGAEKVYVFTIAKARSKKRIENFKK